jgi:heme A synthase
VGSLIIAYCIVNFYWPPMHLRGNEPSLTDALHIVWSMIAVLLMMLMMGFGAAALGKRFRLYTITSIVLLVLFGILTGMEAPNIPTNLPTPFIGVWERIMIALFLLWVIVMAIILLRRDHVPNSVKSTDA